MTSEYSQQVRDRVIAQLADSTLGFNAHIAAIAEVHGIRPFALDFSENSKNFFETNMDPDEIETSSPLKYPLATLCTVSSNNTHRSMFQTFSGAVNMALTIYITWATPRAPQNTERLANAVEAAVVRTFCNLDAMGNFTGPVSYDRVLGASRTPVQIGGEHWRQPLRFTLSFQLDT